MVGIHLFDVILWLEGGVIKDRLSSLVSLSTNQIETMENILKLRMSIDGRGWRWRWRRNIYLWEEELMVKCRQLLAKFFYVW